MTCQPRPLYDQHQFVAYIDGCLTAIAGPAWPATALLGALVVLFAVVLVAAAVIGVRRGTS